MHRRVRADGEPAVAALECICGRATREALVANSRDFLPPGQRLACKWVHQLQRAGPCSRRESSRRRCGPGRAARSRWRARQMMPVAASTTGKPVLTGGPLAAGQHGHAGQRLDHVVVGAVRRACLIAVAVARDRAIDDARVDRLDIVPRRGAAARRAWLSTITSATRAVQHFGRGRPEAMSIGACACRH